MTQQSAAGDAVAAAAAAAGGSAAAAAAAGDVEFTVTPKLQRAAQRVVESSGGDGKSAPGAASAADVEVLRPYAAAAASFDAPAVAIPLRHVQLLSRCYRALPGVSGGGDGYVHDLLDGSSVVAQVTAARKKSPEHEAFLERMRAKAAKREYEGMVQNLRPKDTVFDTLSGGNVERAPPKLNARGVLSGGGPTNPLREAAVGMNVVVVMATGFVVFWYVGKGLFVADGPNSVKPVLCGVLGLIGALLLEVTLLIVRDQKHQLHDQHKLRAAGDAGSAARPAAGEVRVMTGADGVADASAAAAAASTASAAGASGASAAAAAGGAGAAADDGDALELTSVKQRGAASKPPAVFAPLSFGGKAPSAAAPSAAASGKRKPKAA